MPDKKQMTTQEIAVYRLCHHDFAGLTQPQAAEMMGTSQSQVSRTLKKLEVKHPELFPILNKRQAHILTLITGYGRTHQDIADVMNITVRTVERVVSQMRKKGVSFNSPIKTVPYEKYMDSDVKNQY